MSIVVIGAVTKDTLIFPGKNSCRVTESLGGILYVVISLATLTKEKVYPVCNVGYDIYDDLISILKNFKNVQLSHIRKVNVKNIHCYIMWVSEYGTQYDEGREVPISFKQVKPLMPKSKFIFVSPMTGFDIELETLKKIKQTVICPIYLDYHILSLERDKLGNRYLHKRTDWFEWCISCDYLQLNKFEAELLYEKEVITESDVRDFAKPILGKGLKATAVTLGSKGVIICYRDNLSSIGVKHIKGIKTNKVIDAAGCGDVFAAGFISHFLKTENLLESYKFANQIASLKVRITGIQRLSNLIKQMEMK